MLGRLQGHGPGQAFQYLTDRWALIDQGQEQGWLTKERRTTVKALNERLATANYILSGVAPDLALINAYSLADHVGSRSRIRRALNLLSG